MQKEKITDAKSKLTSRTAATLAIIFFLVAVSDFFCSGKKMLFAPTLIVLIYNILMFFNLNNQLWIDRRMFIFMIILTIYFSFLCHYFFLDLFFVAIFCLLFLYTFVLFKNLQRIILCVFIVFNITFLLFLFRENNHYLRSAGDGVTYIGYLRVMAIIAIGVFFYYVADFWSVNKQQQSESFNNDVLEESKELRDIFASINRKDNSFMPLFLNAYPEFADKVLEITPKINDTELEVCALIKLGLTTKEIAIATNSTYKAIESIKYRIRKKLNVDSKTNLMIFFNNI